MRYQDLEQPLMSGEPIVRLSGLSKEIKTRLLASALMSRHHLHYAAQMTGAKIKHIHGHHSFRV